MWYYKQNFIRKSVWAPHVLKHKLAEVLNWLTSMSTATSGDPLPQENLQQAQDCFSNLCKIIDDGHVSGKL